MESQGVSKTGMTQWIRANIGVALLVSMFVGSLLLNVKLAWNLKTPTRPPTGVVVGADLRSIPAVDIAGRQQQLHLGEGRATVLYIMAPTCPWCARNLENIRSLANAAAPGYRFVGLSNTPVGLAEHLTAKPLPFPVYSADTANLPKGLDPGPTPQMVLVNAEGRVEKVWRGALQSKTQAEVEAYFHTKLPGLVKTSPM
jgi:peroxiredoxin